LLKPTPRSKKLPPTLTAYPPPPSYQNIGRFGERLPFPMKKNLLTDRPNP